MYIIDITVQRCCKNKVRLIEIFKTTTLWCSTAVMAATVVAITT